MTEKDFDDFYTLLSAMGDMYGKPISQVVTSIWWNALQQYEIRVIRWAMSQHIKNPDTGQWIPKPADIIRMIGGTSNDKALQAWTKVDSAVRQHGTWRDVVFDDPVIHRVIQDMGGWISLGAKTEHEWNFIQNEFVTRYRGMTHTGQVPEYQSVLIGQASMNNIRNGFKTEEPVLIGDKQRAQQVLSQGKQDTKQIRHVANFIQG